jgi:hypothetical protein
MPKKDDAPDLAVCDGCGMERADVGKVGALDLCDTCEDRHAADPVITVQGRTMHLSELKRQADDDEHPAASLEGDTVQDQIRAARKR